MDQRFYDAVLASPVIAAVKDMGQLEECLTLDNIQVVFLLFGDLCSISDIVAKAKDAGKIVMIHTDLVGGLSSGKEVAVDFLRQSTRADGIISTKPNFIKRARELKMFTVLRLFVIDSMALAGIDKLEASSPIKRTWWPRCPPGLRRCPPPAGTCGGCEPPRAREKPYRRWPAPPFNTGRRGLSMPIRLFPG